MAFPNRINADESDSHDERLPDWCQAVSWQGLASSRHMAYKLPVVPAVTARIQIDLRLAQVRRDGTARQQHRARFEPSIIHW